MRKRIIRSRRARYGGMTVLLTVLLVAVVVLTNVLIGTLAQRYSWYTPMTGTADYRVTETCYSLLDATLGKQNETVRIIFCDTAENAAESDTVSYINRTAIQLQERFPDRIAIEYHNIWLDPDSVRSYTTTFNPATAENVKTTLKSTSVIIAGEDYYRVYDHSEFFVFENGDTSKLWAYNGERKLAAGILHAIDGDAPIACLTKNHGEVFYDYELLYLLDDAGYSLRYIDLYKDPIPEGCRLIISYNPNSDLIGSDGVSATSETDLLTDFLSQSGNSFLVFLEDGTPELPNFEAFLSGWGVETLYTPEDENGNRFRYMVQNASQSLTSDGYTIYGEAAGDGHAAEVLDGLTRKTVFKNATALQAANGFVNMGDGSYKKGDRTLYGLYGSGAGSVSWANGKPANVNRSMLMTLTEQANADGGNSFVGVVASVDFAAETFLQSAVYGNTDTMMRLFTTLGKTNTPEGLTIKPFETRGISTITTAQMWRWTLVLALVPAVVCATLGIVILVRRRRA